MYHLSFCMCVCVFCVCAFDSCVTSTYACHTERVSQLSQSNSETIGLNYDGCILCSLIHYNVMMMIILMMVVMLNAELDTCAGGLEMHTRTSQHCSFVRIAIVIGRESVTLKLDHSASKLASYSVSIISHTIHVHLQTHQILYGVNYVISCVFFQHPLTILGLLWFTVPNSIERFIIIGRPVCGSVVVLRYITRINCTATATLSKVEVDVARCVQISRSNDTHSHMELCRWDTQQQAITLTDTFRGCAAHAHLGVYVSYIICVWIRCPTYLSLPIVAHIKW